MPALTGWHRGEQAIQQKLKYRVANAYTSIEADMAKAHRECYTSRLPFIPIATLDETGRPWGSILAGSGGKPGFVESPDDITLILNAKVWDGDPIHEIAKLFGGSDKMLVGGMGIEYDTRKRYKFAGRVSELNRNGGDFTLEFTINEAVAHCPKYTPVRDLVPHPTTSPQVVHRQPHLSPDDRLPEDVISLIHSSDNLYLGTCYEAPEADKDAFPSHLGVNSRGGPPGFVRVTPSDGRTLVLPDFSGNRWMTSLGNIEVTPLASLTFVSFTTGAVLYVTGIATTLIGPAAQKIMPLQNALTTIYVTGYILVLDALPVRQRPNTKVESSPYNPPLRLLAEESPSPASLHTGPGISASLARIDILSPSLATFTWESSKEIQIKPGQSVLMDFAFGAIGAESYQQIAAGKPITIHDGRFRTWTVSSSHPATGTRTFSLVMREQPGGASTGALFEIARKLSESQPEVLQNSRPLELSVRLVNVSGDFCLPEAEAGAQSTKPAVPKRLLWFAGGIGLTPYLSMLSALATSPRDSDWDIVLILSTREPEVLLPLISAALQGKGSARVHMSLDVFSDRPIPDLDTHSHVILRRHTGRFPHSFFTDSCEVDGEGREMYMCGPKPFEKAVVAALGKAGLDSTNVKKEGFGY